MLPSLRKIFMDLIHVAVHDEHFLTHGEWLHGVDPFTNMGLEKILTHKGWCMAMQGDYPLGIPVKGCNFYCKYTYFED
jgi:hypothetical protein